MSSRETKRQRTDEEVPTRSSVWYEDGNLILQVENTQFRVHWGVLAKHSSFFREKPRPSDATTEIVISLKDPAKDVEYFLEVLYNPLLLTEAALPLHCVGALIRLGRKYDFRDLFTFAVERLTFENPSTLEEYETLVSDSAKVHTTKRIAYYPGINFDMLTLVRENKIWSALPCAYYLMILNHTQAAVFDGIQRPDGTKASLAKIDLRRCLLGREKIFLAQWENGNTLEWLKTRASYEGCLTPSECDSWRVDIFDATLFTGTVGPFARPLIEVVPNLCTPCKEYIRGCVARGRQKMWDELPTYFELPPWKELKKDL